MPFVPDKADAQDTSAKGPEQRRYVSPTGDFILAYDQDVRYVNWQGTRGYPTTGGNSGSGWQVYSPFALRMLARPNSDWSFDLLARGGYVDSKQTTTGQTGAYSGPIDTLVSGTVTYRGNPNFHPFVSLAMNLPTGETELFGNRRFARMDPDIVYVPTFGEGFNVGPTVGVAIPFNKTTSLTLAAGYTNRGSYTREDGPTGTFAVDVSPADETSVTANFRQKLSDVFTYWAGATYAWQTVTKLTFAGGFLQVEPGNRITVDLGARYSWTPRWSSTARFAYTHLDQNFASDNFGALGIPGTNANNDTYFTSLDLVYGIANSGVGVRGSYFRREGNEYSVAIGNFVPAKDKYQLTAFATIPASERLFFNAEISRIWTNEAAAPASATPPVDLDGWTFVVGAKYAFLP